MSDSGYPGSDRSSDGYHHHHPHNKVNGGNLPAKSVTKGSKHAQGRTLLQDQSFAIQREQPSSRSSYHARQDSCEYLQTTSDNQRKHVIHESPSIPATPRSVQMSEQDILHNGEMMASTNAFIADTASQNRYPLGYGGWSPSKQMTHQYSKKTEQSDTNDADMIRKKAQVDAYVKWVNAQLKRVPGTRLIEDLKCDLQDGVALVTLVEVVGKEKLDGVYMHPSSSQEMLANIDQVIDFMVRRRIRMHHTTATDIVEGDLKSIMRLILALAAHFKPNSVKQSSSSNSNRSTPSKTPQQSLASLAQTASVMLADARRDIARTSQRPRRPKHLRHREEGRGASGTSSDSDHSTLRQPIYPPPYRPPPPPPPYSPREADIEGSSSTSGSHRRLEFTGSVPKSRSHDFSKDSGSDGVDSAAAMCELEEGRRKIEMLYLDLQREHQSLAMELDDTKTTMLKLQQLLLSGCSGTEAGSGDDEDGEEAGAPAASEYPQEQLVILQAKLQQAELAGQRSREELSRITQECLQLQGVKCALEQRLSEQEQASLAMKSEVLRAGFCQQGLETTKADLEQKLEDKDQLVLELRRDLARREREVDEMKASLQQFEQDKDTTTQNLRAQIYDLHERLKHVGQTEASLSAKVESQDRKMTHLEGRILHSQGALTVSDIPRPSSARSTQSGGSGDELQMVRESLHSLRSHFPTSYRGPGDDSSHLSAIEALETSIATLVEKLHISSNQPPSIMSESSRSRNFDSTGDYRRSPLPHGYPSHCLDASLSNGHGSTKVLYFTDRTVTPFMVTLPKRLGEISLRDIKTIVDRPGNYRYHFKAQDPEFGTVKEEVIHEDALVPGWEGKIVAWIEEDNT